MISPTDEDIGRKVRWLSRRRNIGTLAGFNDHWGFVRFAYETEPMPAALDDLYWADDHLGEINYDQGGEKQALRATDI